MTRRCGSGPGPGGCSPFPYPQEVNDIPSIVARKDAAAQFADMIVDDFEERLHQTRDGLPQVMGIALHPYLVGQPHRLRQLRRALSHLSSRRDVVWITTAGRHPGPRPFPAGGHRSGELTCAD
jgi:allantoinase